MFKKPPTIVLLGALGLGALMAESKSFRYAVTHAFYGGRSDAISISKGLHNLATGKVHPYVTPQWMLAEKAEKAKLAKEGHGPLPKALSDKEKIELLKYCGIDGQKWNFTITRKTAEQMRLNCDSLRALKGNPSAAELEQAANKALKRVNPNLDVGKVGTVAPIINEDGRDGRKDPPFTDPNTGLRKITPNPPDRPAPNPPPP